MMTDRTKMIAAVVLAVLSMAGGAFGTCRGMVKSEQLVSAREEIKTLAETVKTKDVAIQQLETRLSTEEGEREREERRPDGTVIKERERYSKRLEETLAATQRQLESARVVNTGLALRNTELEARLQAPPPGPTGQLLAFGGINPMTGQSIAAVAARFGPVYVLADNPIAAQLDPRILAGLPVFSWGP